MSGRVIQGFFVGGRAHPPARIVQAAAPARAAIPGHVRPGPPPPAFAGRAAAAQARPALGWPPPAHHAAQVAQAFGGSESFEIDPVQIGLARGGGQPLPQALLAKMEAAFSADFSGVRIHVGPQASRIGAVAFTMGDDVYFAPGKFQPDSAQGQQLIGHELAHVIQQRQGRVRAPGSGVAVVQDRMLEAEADRLGMRAAAMQPRRPSAMVQRAAASGRPLALRGAIQREPLAKVAVNRRTPLRQSHDGLSLSSGADIGVLDPGTEIEIDLGDQWLSRLGDGAVGDVAAHTWYRVVKHGGNAVRADIYLRGGTFDVVGQTTAAQGYVVCFRFCNAQDPETFKSHLSKGKSWSSPNKPRADLPESLLKRAMSHMDGSIDKSPFVSVATSEQALLRFGHSGGLKNVIFGATVPAERAPHIAIFHIPEGRLVSPAFLKATVHGAAQFIGLARAQVETELVYYGDDIQTYMVRYKDNPYNVHHYQALLAELDTD